MELDKEVSSEEIQTAFLSLHPNKAPGTDGFNAYFFRKTWHILGEDVILAIKHFFSSGHLLKELNATVITLIPKLKNSSSLHEYRPISCCGTIYKCISKVIALMIKKVLPSLIDRAQAAFIPGRLISDNVLLAQELMRGYHRADSPSRGAIKVDLKKAFDSVRWDFILDLLEGLHFPPHMIR